MKTIASFLSVSIAAGSAGVALLTLSGVISADLGFALLVVLGLAAIARFDYIRPARSLHTLAPVLRPALPCESASPVAYSARRVA